MDANPRQIILFVVFPVLLASTFYSWGWDTASIAIGILISVGIVTFVSAGLDLGWKCLAKFSASQQTETEIRLIPILKSIFRYVYRPSLPLSFFMFFMAFSLQGFFLVGFVCLEMLYLLLIGILATIVKVGEKYPGVLSVVMITLLWLFEHPTLRTKPNYRSASDLPKSADASVYTPYQPYEEGYQPGPLTYYREGDHLYPYPDEASSIHSGGQAYPPYTEMPPQE